jgi:hypothetical protein
MDPPAADTCLTRAYASRKRKGKPQKGGTMVRGDVKSLEEHERCLDRDGYRLGCCGAPDCSGELHRHQERTRQCKVGVAAALSVLLVVIMIFRCAKCGATWRVLPGFLARCLHREWWVVERVAATAGVPWERGEPHPRELAPARTRRRWAARLVQAALVPVQVLATSGDVTLRALAQALGLQAERGELVERYAAIFGATSAFASLAELLHRLMPGIRLT